MGIHRPYYESSYFKGLTPAQARQKYVEIDADVRQYFKSMDIPEWAVNKMLQFSSRDMYYLSKEELALLQNAEPWIDELIIARCGKLRSGITTDSQEFRDWVKCAAPVQDEGHLQGAIDYLAERNEKMPPLERGSSPQPEPVQPVTPAPGAPKPVSPFPEYRPTPPAHDVMDDYTLRQNRDADGVDISPMIRDVDISQCALACKNRSGCQAFSYDRWNRACFLKNGVTALRLDPKSTVGYDKQWGTPPAVVSDPAKMFNYRNKFFPGDGYNTFQSQSYENCLSVCQKDLSCVAFNYYKQNKMCRLFKYTDQYFRDDSVDAGVKTQTN